MSENSQQNQTTEKREHYITIENFYYNEDHPNQEKIQSIALNILNTAKISGRAVIDFSQIKNPLLTKDLYSIIWGAASALNGSLTKFNEEKSLYIIKM